MSQRLITIIRRNVSNLPGWCTRRNLVVLESDDWGSIRMPSPEVYKYLIMAGIDLVSDAGALFNKFDTLASNKDIAGLFEVLNAIRDSSDRPAVITPVSVVANPDFDRIRAEDFTRYFYEPITETLKRYKGCEDSFRLWHEGIRNRLFVPQFHGREHLNVREWMKALKIGNKTAKTGFDNRFWGMTTENEPDIPVEFQAAFDFYDPTDLQYHSEIILTGLDLFQEVFGYRASYFVPPNGPLSSSLECLMVRNGIKYLSMPRIQQEPLGNGKNRKRIHWLGRRLKTGLTIISRNCFFEPVVPGKDWVDSCLSDISIAFKWQKPAIISSHRVNYVGGLSEKSGSNGLQSLNKLLKGIMIKWPKAEFLTSEELGKIIHNG